MRSTRRRHPTSESIAQFEELSRRFPDDADCAEQLGAALTALATFIGDLWNDDEWSSCSESRGESWRKRWSPSRRPELVGQLATTLRILGHTTFASNAGPAEQYLLRSQDAMPELIAKAYEPEEFGLQLGHGDIALAALYYLTIARRRRNRRTSAPSNFLRKTAPPKTPPIRHIEICWETAVEAQAIGLMAAGATDEGLQAFRRMTDDLRSRSRRNCPERKSRLSARQRISS